MTNVNEFYTKVLPSKGSAYCIATINKKGVKHHFVDSIEEIPAKIESLKEDGTQTYFATASFDGYTRKQDHAEYFRSLFIDIDAGENKDYPSKQEALEALLKFIDDTKIPVPTLVDSGNGIHAYWCLEEDLPKEEYIQYSHKLRDFCLDKGLNIDRAVMGDAARIMRSPNTLNWKSNPPIPTRIISDTITTCSAEEVTKIIGDVEPNIQDILKQAKGPMSEDQRKILKLDNFKSKFETIAIKSIKGEGCKQIANILSNARTLAEPYWYAGLSIAQHCSDRDQAIHKMSEEHPGYSAELTERKATQTQDKPFTCAAFSDLDSKLCEGCKHKGKVTTPLQLGKEFVPAPSTSVSPAEIKQPVAQLAGLPKDLNPFVYGENGGIYYQLPTMYDDEGNPLPPKPPVLVSLYDLYPVKRIFSKFEGEALLMKYHPPHDDVREFLLPMKNVYALDKFRDTLASKGILYSPSTQQGKYLMEYIYTWGQYLMARTHADEMRDQMGYTENKKAFVIGKNEVKDTGEVVEATTSETIKNVVTFMHTAGDYDKWKEAANRLNEKSLEIHAFCFLTGFGSTLMNRTSTSGVTISLTGHSGAGKTGALYSALSIWGNPKDLSVLQNAVTENGIVGRYLTMHNLPFGLDEVGNIPGVTLSNTIHKISQGKAKIRMHGSVNAERDHEFSASLIALFTTNHSLYDKLSVLKKDPNGEVARLIEFPMRKPQLFSDVPSSSREIFDVFRLNYGWAGIDFIKSLYATPEEVIEEKLTTWGSEFKKDFGDDSVYRFYENLIAATFTAGEIANKAGIIDIDLDRVYKTVVAEMINIRDKVIRVNNVDYESLLGEYISQHHSGLLAIEENNVTMEPRTSLVMRADIDNSLLFIEKKHFKAYCIENGVSPNEFVFSMKELGYHIEDNKRRMGTGWKPAAGLSSVWTYKIDTTKFLADILKEQTTET